MFCAFTYECDHVAYLKLFLLKVTFGSDAIDECLAREVAQDDIAIFGLYNLCYDAADTILRFAYRGFQELGNGGFSNGTILGDDGLRRAFL